jgi:integral membrane protein
VHGWLYVLYLYACFRVWTETRWSFFRFLVMAAGGVVPFLSFFTENYYGRLAKGDSN